MAKKNQSKTVKESKKTLASKVEATKVVKENVNAEVEAAKKTGEFPPKPEVQQEPVKTPEAPVEVQELVITPKNEEPIIPETVEQTKPKKKEEDTIPSISAGLNKLANGDRIDHNHSIDLMKMIHSEYVTNPATTPELGKAMKKQFDAMAMIELMFYNAQLENDLQQLGVKVNKEQFAQMEGIARSMFGISLKGLPAPDDPNQLVINFPESVPQPVKEQVKKDLKAKKEVTEIPEPDVNLPKAVKLKTLQAIFSQTGRGIGNNIQKGIDWGKIAFGFNKDERDAVVLANLLSNDFRTTLTNGLTGMVRGKLNSDHSIIGAHAILHQWLPNYSDQDLAEIAQVCLSYKEEANVKDYKERTGKEISLDNGLTLLSRDMLAGCSSNVIDAILNKKEQVVVDYPDGTGKLAINTAAIRKSLVCVYGDSDNLLKDKLNDIVKYYVKPIMRLAKYVDKSAYSTAVA